MCREVEPAKGERASLAKKAVALRKPALRPLQELKRDFRQRVKPAEAKRSQNADVLGRAKAEVKTESSKVARGEANKHALASLDQLQRDFCQRLGGGREGDAAPPALAEELDGKPFQTGILKKLVEGKGFGFIVPNSGGSKDVFLHFSDLLNGGSEDMVVGMRVSYIGEVDPKSGKTRARNAAIVDFGEREARVAVAVPPSMRQQKHSRSARDCGGDAKVEHHVRADEPTVKSDEDASISKEASDPFTYDREKLLSAFRRVYHADQDSRVASLGIRTVPMPPSNDDSLALPRRAGGHSGHYAEDPKLDDEDLIVEMEDRLSRESGADAKNFETFGDCLGGWTFEEALEANARLPCRAFPGTCCPLSLVVSEEQRTGASPLDVERCLSTVPSSEDLEHCFEAASSGTATPSGQRGFAKGGKDLWVSDTPCFQ
mmetsp:Transcript_69352/g.224212  ORF Transcript_69352/g.224212 Transcript_69352/m.224212 type:complete len:431 (+) Transcript_69352:92-1384(+)